MIMLDLNEFNSENLLLFRGEKLLNKSQLHYKELGRLIQMITDVVLSGASNEGRIDDVGWKYIGQIGPTIELTPSDQDGDTSDY
jgi:hypothetical protein